MDKITIALIGTIALALVGVVGDFFINLAGEGRKFMDVKWFVLGLIIYASTAIGWFFLMKIEKLSTIGVFYAVTTVLFLTLLSVFYFKESITVPEVIGIAFAIVSLILMGRFA